MTRIHRSPPWRPRLAATSALLFLAAAWLVLSGAGCGEGSQPSGLRAEAKAQPGRYGRIETDEFGSTQIRALEPRAKLEIEVGDNSFGVTFTSQTPGRLRYELRRRPLSLDCRFDAPWDGGDLGVLDLNWRDDYDDWGLALLDFRPTRRRWRRSCDVLSGEPGGDPRAASDVVFSRVGFR